MMSRSSARWTLSRLVLNLAAALGALALVMTVAGWAFGVTPLVFRSGSMAPTVDTGGLGLAREVPASELAEGDIVTVSTDAGSLVTHRIVNLNDVKGPAVELTLKGDANTVADVKPYVVTEAQRVFWTANHLGRVVAWSRTPAAMFLAGLLAAWLLLTYFRGPRPNQVDAVPRSQASARHRRRGRRIGQRSVQAGALLLVAVGGASASWVSAAPSTWAAFTDSAGASGSFSTLTVPAPSNLQCSATNGGLLANDSARVSWTPPSTPLTPVSYVVNLRRNGVTTPVSVAAGTTSYTIPNNSAAGTYSISVNSVYLGWSSAQSNSVTLTKGTKTLGFFVSYACS